MKTIKKTYLLSVLGLAMFTQAVRANDTTIKAVVATTVVANETTYTKIHKAVEARLAEKKLKNTALDITLAAIKADILAIIAAECDSTKYATLKTDLEQLDIAALQALTVALTKELTKLQKILNTVSKETKDLVLKALIDEGTFKSIWLANRLA